MRIARLLAVVSLLCSFSVLAQDEPKVSPNGAVPAPNAVAPVTTAVAAEPSRIAAVNASALNASKSPFTQLQSGMQDQRLNRDDVDNFLTDPPSNKAKTAGINEESANDSECLYIRSYVVARDGKDSDSTHMVSYSTCQPARRYGLKTTELKQNSPSH
jgi:hypothetical protein